MGHIAVGALGTQRRLVQTLKRGQMTHWGLVKGALLEDYLLQVCDQGKHEITHLLILWFLPGILMLFPFISQCMGCLV